MTPLPTELLAFITQYASIATQASLARVSETLHALAVQPMYASIPRMDHKRTIQCLHTLSQNASRARVVRSYTIIIDSEDTPQNLPKLLADALVNMSNITILCLIVVGGCATSSVLKGATFNLTQFTCRIVTDPVYPISRFLDSQPGINVLSISCRADGMADLPPEALPAPQDVEPPIQTLYPLLSSRVGKNTRVTVLGAITSVTDILRLGDNLHHAHDKLAPGTSIDVLLSVDITPRDTTGAGVTNLLVMLYRIGQRAPWIKSLGLEVHNGVVEPYQLKYGIATALSQFPNIKTLMLMSSPPPPGAYTHESHSQAAPRMQIGPFEPSQTTWQHLFNLTPWSDEPIHDTESPYDIPDALHNSSTHLDCLSLWKRVQSNLERVVLPTGVYTYVAKKGNATNEGGVRMSVSFQPRQD